MPAHRLPYDRFKGLENGSRHINHDDTGEIQINGRDDMVVILNYADRSGGATLTCSLPSPALLPVGLRVTLVNGGTDAVTVTEDGITSLVLEDDESAILMVTIQNEAGTITHEWTAVAGPLEPPVNIS